MFYRLIIIWFGLVRDWGYWGVAGLMALESTICPIPSEVVVPPAAYWASQGQMTFWGVVVAATAGSYLGSILSYYIAQRMGRPLVLRWGHYALLSPQKLLFAEQWVARHGMAGIFVARMLPVVRHLISLPAGMLKMNFWRFSLATITGSALWCYILAWFGEQVIGDQPHLMNDPNVMVQVMKDKLLTIILAVVIVGGLYTAIRFQIHRSKGGRHGRLQNHHIL